VPSEHARLSASGSHRWLMCPPSLLLEEQFPESTSKYAEEGRMAHAAAERALRGQEPEPGDEEFEIADYVTYVLSRKQETLGLLHVEQKLDLSAYVPDGFGTGDAVLFYDDEVEIIDLKYGKGVVVDVTLNPQFMLYGLGAYWTFEPVHDVKRVRTTCVQPRNGGVSTAVYTVDALLSWAAETVAPAAIKAVQGEGEFHPSDETCRFCKAKGICKARADVNSKEIVEIGANTGLKDPRLLTVDQISKVLVQADFLLNWLGDVQSYALELAESGTKIPGYKLVEGRSNRKYADDILVAEALRAKGWPDEVIYQRKLLGLTALEKVVGKKTLAELPEGLIVKPAGKPVLVPESDKRLELNSAQSDFAHIE
jgi:hypothetical protein